MTAPGHGKVDLWGYLNRDRLGAALDAEYALTNRLSVAGRADVFKRWGASLEYQVLAGPVFHF